MMKLQRKFILLLFILLSNYCFAQQTRLSFQLNDVTLSEAIKKVSVQYKVNIIYNSTILQKTAKVSGNFKNKTIFEVLDILLTETPIVYKIHKNVIILCLKNDVVNESHQLSRPVASNAQDAKRYTITDTVVYSIVSHDTIVTRLTDYVKVQVNDTVTIYDTVKVVKNIFKAVAKPKSKKSSWGIGASLGVGFPISKIYSKQLDAFSTQLVNTSTQSWMVRSATIDFFYRYMRFEFETGVGIISKSSSFRFSTITDSSSVENKYVSEQNFQHLSVPFLVGYSMPYKKIILKAKGGILFQNYLNSSGEYLVSQNNVFLVERKTAPEANYSMGFVVAIGAEYVFNEKIGISIQPYFHSIPFAFPQTTTLYYSLSSQFGTKLGIRYFF